MKPLPPMDGDMEAAEDMIVCDPYYGCRPEQVVAYDYYHYSKSMLHPMVWTALFQVAVPTAIFSVLEPKAFEDKFGTQT